ncbi:MAG TPA: glycosyltransferase family 9 protein [Candidatus Krumholzibacteria bacterium]|jgi:ADP-heptose:LPS heptosyltransferase
MSKALLKRLLGRGEEREASGASFHLPGALAPGARVLLVDSGDLTDLLFAMPFVQRLPELYPGASAGLLCGERCSELALSSSSFAELIVHDDEALQPGTTAAQELENLLGKGEWDLAILLGTEADPRRERLAAASGAALRVGPGHDNAYPHVNFELRPMRNDLHPSYRTRTWGRLLGVALDDTPLGWTLEPGAERQMAQLIHFNKPRKDQLLVGVDPGVGKAGTVLAPENIAFLINHVASHIRCKTLTLSSDSDGARMAELGALLRSEQLDLPRPTLREHALLLAQCDLFICGNTDLFHLAVALSVPTVGIFTDADDDRWIPPSGGRFEILRSVEGERLSLSDLMERVDRLLPK